MKDLSLLVQYADKVKARFLQRKNLLQEKREKLLSAWKNAKRLPLSDYKIPELKPAKAYSVIAVDSSPLDVSRHRALKLKALSLARVFTDYEKGEEIIENEIVDIPETDELATLSFPLLELKYLCEGTKADLALVDGSLIRWQWWEWQEEKRLQYLKAYTDLLHQAYQKAMPILAIIDRSHSRDITHLLEIETKENFSEFVDTDLFNLVLEENSFSPVFMSYSPVTKLINGYEVAFCYYRGFNNVLRIEFLPHLLKENIWPKLVSQIEKGKGFPWSLARAHDLCVVKEHEKQLLEKMLQGEGISQKEFLKK